MVQLMLRLTTPPGRLQQTIQALRSVTLPARLKCGEAFTHLAREVGDDRVLCYMEEWSDVEELNEQIRSPRFGQLLALLETLVEEPTFEFRFVSEVRGLDYVAEVRGEPLLAERAPGDTATKQEV